MKTLAILLLLSALAGGAPTVRVVAWNLHHNQDDVAALSLLHALAPDVVLCSEGILLDPLFVSIGEDQSLDAYGLHFYSIRDRPANPTAALAECLARLATLPRERCVVGGDFNVTRVGGGYSVGTAPGSIEAMEAAAFVSAIDAPTFSASYPSVQFDWLFATPDVRVVAAGVAGLPLASDHRLVWADLVVPDARATTLLTLGLAALLLRRRRRG